MVPKSVTDKPRNEKYILEVMVGGGREPWNTYRLLRKLDLRGFLGTEFGLSRASVTK